LEWADTGDFDAEVFGGPEDTLYILDDSRFRDFDPLVKDNLLKSDAYEATFGGFLSGLEEFYGQSDGSI
jgi:hypothetical protein